MAFSEILDILKDTRPFLINIETKRNKTFRGNLIFLEENMNCVLENTIMIEGNGKITKFKSVFLRGNNIKMFVIPEIFSKTPYLSN